MAKSKNIKRWITIEGNHIPVYEDGSLGGAAEKMGLSKETTGSSVKDKESDRMAWTEKAPMSQEEFQQKYGKKSEAQEKAEKDFEEYIKFQQGINKNREDAVKQDEIDKISKTEHISKAEAKKIYDEGSFEAELEEYSDPEYKNVTEGVKTEKQLAKEKGSSFSADSAAKKINDISMNHNNRGGDTENDWKQVRDTLEEAPVGTTMIQTGDRGAKYQFTKGEDGKWHGSWDSDSKTLSMGWVGQGHRPSVEFTTPDKALTNEQLKDTQTAAVNGALNQRLGLSKSGKPITRADMAGTGVTSNTSGRNMPARSQEQLGTYDKYKQGYAYNNAKEVNVNGNTYKVWSDQSYKGTFAEDKDGNVLPISGSGYLSNELSQRKAIANKFGEPSFRSKSIKVGDKEVSVSSEKSSSGSNLWQKWKKDNSTQKDAEWRLDKYDRRSLIDLAFEAGVPDSQSKKMTTDELRKMLLSMWKK